MPVPLTDPATFALVGAGATASVLGRRLVQCSFRVVGVTSRTEASAARLAAELGAHAAPHLRVAHEADAILLCVPDDALADVVARLSADLPTLDGRLVLHTSGAQPVRLLAPLTAQGAYVLGFHPAQALTRDTPPETLAGAFVGLEGQEPALSVGRRLAEALGMRPLTIRLGSKALYHLALAVASNYTVTLVALAGEVLESAGLNRDDARALVQPLLAGTVTNLERHPPEQALTGPIVRGDVETVEHHLTALRTLLPHLVPVYAALAAEAARVAVRGGRLSSEQADALLERLEAAL